MRANRATIRPASMAVSSVNVDRDWEPQETEQDGPATVPGEDPAAGTGRACSRSVVPNGEALRRRRRPIDMERAALGGRSAPQKSTTLPFCRPPFSVSSDVWPQMGRECRDFDGPFVDAPVRRPPRWKVRHRERLAPTPRLLCSPSALAAPVHFLVLTNTGQPMLRSSAGVLSKSPRPLS